MQNSSHWGKMNTIVANIVSLLCQILNEFTERRKLCWQLKVLFKTWAARGGYRGSQISHVANVKKAYKQIWMKVFKSFRSAQLLPFISDHAILTLSHSSMQTSIRFCTLSQRLISKTISQISGIPMKMDYSAL